MARLNDLLGETLKTILDLPRYYDELSGGLKGRVADDFGKYGLELVDFLIGAITPPEEVQKMIDERAGMGAIGDMQRYMAFKAARGIEAAATNPGEAGSAAGLGLGAGIGMMMPQMIAGAMGAQGRGPGGGAARRGGAGAVRRRPRRPARSASRAVPAGTKFCGNCGDGHAGRGRVPEVPDAAGAGRRSSAATAARRWAPPRRCARSATPRRRRARSSAATADRASVSSGQNAS